MLDVVLGVLVDELLEVRNNRLGDSLTDGVNLRGVSSSSDADADVDVGELLKTDDQEGLVDLEPQDLGLDEVQGLAVDLKKTLTGLAVSDGGSWEDGGSAVCSDSRCGDDSGGLRLEGCCAHHKFDISRFFIHLRRAPSSSQIPSSFRSSTTASYSRARPLHSPQPIRGILPDGL